MIVIVWVSTTLSTIVRYNLYLTENNRLNKRLKKIILKFLRQNTMELFFGGLKSMSERSKYHHPD